MKKYPSKKQISLLIAAFFLILASCAPRVTPLPEEPSSIVISTFTAGPPASPQSQDITPILESTPDSSVVGKLPALSPVNVTVGLEGQHFTCTAVKKAVMYYQRTCTKGLPSETLLQVVIYGREPFIVDFIEASVKQSKNPDPKIAADLLGFVASLPYEGATTVDAKTWVETTISTSNGNLGDAQEKAFGGVNFVLHGTPEALTLEMGELPS